MVFDPSASVPDPNVLFVNRMSPSAWDRGGGGAVYFTQHFLDHLERSGVEVVNGAGAYRLDISKAAQSALLERLGLPTPRTRVAYDPRRLLLASQELVFPVLVKPNMGGNGAGIERFDTPPELAAAVAAESLLTGPDGVYLVQEYHPPRGGHISRVETLEGRFLYGIRLHLEDAESFSICPADVCSLVSGEKLNSVARGASEGNGAKVEAFTPPPEMIAEIERIVGAAGFDMGSVEYLESERDGRRYYYDLNALSNFIADPVKVVGFDPTARLVDALAGRALALAA